MISDSISARVRDLRQREGISRAELAERARAAGAPASFTAVVVGNLETGRVKQGARTRDFTVSEVLWLAAALEVSALELLDDAAPVFLGSDGAGCARCASETGTIEAATRESLDKLAELHNVEPALVAGAIQLARDADSAQPDERRRILKEWRATLEVLAAGRRRHPDPGDGDGDEDRDEFDDLDQPEPGAAVDLSGIDASALDEPPGPDDLDDPGEDEPGS